MNTYSVKVRTYLPYPMERRYRLEASNFGAVASLAIKKFRKDIGRKKITELRIEIIKL